MSFRGNVQRGSQVQNFSPNITINVNSVPPPRPLQVDASPTKSSDANHKISFKLPFLFNYEISWKSSFCRGLCRGLILAGIIFFIYSTAGVHIEDHSSQPKPNKKTEIDNKKEELKPVKRLDCDSSTLFRELKDDIADIVVFGTCLQINLPIIEKISRETSGKVDNGLIKLINYWLESLSVGANCWKGVVDALQCMEKTKLSQRIEQKYLNNST